MNDLRIALIITLIGSLFATGCQSESLQGMFVEYRPPAKPVEKPAFDSGVFVLWRWVPVTPLAGDPSTRSSKPADDRPVEVKQVYADAGSPVGFLRSNGQLTAIAGTTSVPLEEAHYAWTALTAANEKSDEESNIFGFWVAWWYWTSTPWSFALGTPNIDSK